MGAVAIEINDTGIVVANETQVLATEPGFAFVDGAKIVTGELARAQARLKPRQTSSRFWSGLSMDPGSAGAGIAKSAAEIAYAQLEALWKRLGAGVTDVVLVVPGAYRADQLGLLLGLAQECGMPVRALVDAAAAASVRQYPGRQLVYVDASLYRVSVTLIEQSGEAAVQAEHALTQGLAGLADAFAKRFAELFVRATRFDPFAHAETEQLLYDRQPAWLEALQREERFELSLSYRNEEFRVVAERDALVAVARGFYRAGMQLVSQQRDAGKGLVVQISDRIASLPWFLGELARLDDAEAVCFGPGHAARSALLAPAATQTTGQVKLLKRLAFRAEPSEASVAERPRAASATPEVARTQPPTHVVYGGLAYSVGGAGLAIGREADPKRRTLLVAEGVSGISRLHCEIVMRDGELRLRDFSSFGTFVNEKKIAGEVTLRRADVIRVGSPGVELHVVSLEGE
jgi:hypothetical protein